ncbi:MAG: hypothetical protein HY902_02640 [Deltaproteobacteria bacterium]|nr:hypothetical protein [Deltaproteobacteria bacterium]
MAQTIETSRAARRTCHSATAVWAATVLTCTALSLAGCGSAEVVDEAPLAPQHKTAGLVVLPVALATADASPLEVAAHSLLVGRVVLEQTDLPVIGLFDFDVNKPLDEAHTPAYDTDLVTHAELGGDWQDWLALHVLVTENRATNVRDIVDTRVKDPKKPNTYRQHGVEARVHVEAALYEARRGNRLAWTTLDIEDNPLEFEPGEDPRPEVTKAINSAVRRLIDLAPALRNGLGGRRARGDGLVDSLQAIAAYKYLDAKPYAAGLTALPDEVKAAKLLVLFDRFAPGLPAHLAASAIKHDGVLLRADRAPLKAGDIVQTVAGIPVRAAHQFDRLLRGCANAAGGCAVSVQRGGALQALQVQWPSLPPIPAPAPVP